MTARPTAMALRLVLSGLLAATSAGCGAPAQGGRGSSADENSSETTQPGSDPTDDRRHVLVFVQAAVAAETNSLIFKKLRPVMRCIARSNAATQYEVVALYSRTSAGTVLLHGEIPPGLKGHAAAAQLGQELSRRGPTLLDRLYPEGGPIFMDVLGSVFVIDNYIARHDVTPQVIYVADMLQQTGDEGYDFSGGGEGRSIDMAEGSIEREYGAKLQQRQRMAGMQVDAVMLDLPRLARQSAGPQMAEVATPRERVEAFWRDKFFGGMLKARFKRYPEDATCSALGFSSNN